MIFYAYPLLSSIYYSFTSYSILNPGEFVGLRNYRELLQDNLFWKSIANTLIFTAMSVPVNIILVIVIALLLNNKISGIGVYRTTFFIPTLVPVVATATVWRWLLNSNYGLFNSFLEFFGLSPIPWLASEDWSKISLVMIAAWGIGQAIVINLGGLQDISPEYYEAASIDGANAWQKAIRITLPLLTPVIFYNIVMGLINSLQIFTLPLCADQWRRLTYPFSHLLCHAPIQQRFWLYEDGVCIRHGLDSVCGDPHPHLSLVRNVQKMGSLSTIRRLYYA